MVETIQVDKLKEKYYLVEEDILISLIKDSLILNALENGGVDNWEWYEDSINDFLANSEVNDFDELVKKQLFTYNIIKITHNAGGIPAYEK